VVVMLAAMSVGSRYGYATKSGILPNTPGHFFAGDSNEPPMIAPATPPKPQQNLRARQPLSCFAEKGGRGYPRMA
jgi:hypothetical protein